MRPIRHFFTAAIVTASAGSALANDEAITEALSGKTIKSATSNVEFTFNSNGSLKGKAGPNQGLDIEGTWKVEDGNFCRTLTTPRRMAGTLCQKITMGDGAVTLSGPNGTVRYTVQ